MPNNWLLLQTKPREESRASQHLQNLGCTTYYPEIQVEKITRGKRTTKIEPLFPGYLFVQDPDTQAANAPTYSSIRSTRGVSKIVKFGTKYTLLPDSLITQVKGLTSTGSDPYLQGTNTAPQQGDKVQITAGPFKGLEAIFQQPDGQMRSMVLINILHQQTSITLDNTAMALTMARKESAPALKESDPMGSDSYLRNAQQNLRIFPKNTKTTQTSKKITTQLLN